MIKYVWYCAEWDSIEVIPHCKCWYGEVAVFRDFLTGKKFTWHCVGEFE